MKKVLIAFLVFFSITQILKAQDFFNYGMNMSIHTPVDKAIFTGGHSITDIPDGTECELKFTISRTNNQSDIILKGLYDKKIGNSFLFSTTSKLFFLVDMNNGQVDPIIPSQFIPLDTTIIKEITSEKQMYQLWRTKIFFDNKDLTKRIQLLSVETQLNAIEDIKNWPFSNVENTLIKLSENKNMEIAKNAKRALIYWRKTFSTLLITKKNIRKKN